MTGKVRSESDNRDRHFAEEENFTVRFYDFLLIGKMILDNSISVFFFFIKYHLWNIVATFNQDRDKLDTLLYNFFINFNSDLDSSRPFDSKFRDPYLDFWNKFYRKFWSREESKEVSLNLWIIKLRKAKVVILTQFSTEECCYLK